MSEYDIVCGNLKENNIIKEDKTEKAERVYRKS